MAPITKKHLIQQLNELADAGELMVWNPNVRKLEHITSVQYLGEGENKEAKIMVNIKNPDPSYKYSRCGYCGIPFRPDLKPEPRTFCCKYCATKAVTLRRDRSGENS